MTSANSPALRLVPPLPKESSEPSLRDIIEKVAHLLPEQAPLHAFVHHNTLHAFESLPFEEAVVKAAEILGTEPFQTEAEFAGHLRTGRISSLDINAVVADKPDEKRIGLFWSGPTRLEFQRGRLKTLFKIPQGAALSYLLCEQDPREQIDVGVSAARRKELAGMAQDAKISEATLLCQLWETLAEVAPQRPASNLNYQRRRDELLLATEIDTDEIVHPILIRLCAAFLDQGLAYWQMPGRDVGFLSAVRRLYGLSAPPPDRALGGLASQLRVQEAEEWSAEKTILWGLEQLDVASEDRALYIQESLLALRGWAGMIRHLERRPDRAPVEAFPATLEEFLAVRLVFDAVAARNCLSENFGVNAKFSEQFSASSQQSDSLAAGVEPSQDVALIYESFILAQRLPLDLNALANPNCAIAWLQEVCDFDELERRRLLHLAYERRHRVEVLDGIAAHARLDQPEVPRPVFQSAFCIDDREESLRRHVEECFPKVDTYGYAGFFGVAMEYQGFDDIRPRPLCPVSIQPKHVICERAVDDELDAKYRKRRQRFGKVQNNLSVGTLTMTRGGLVSMALGSLALVPLVFRSLFPRIAVAWTRLFAHQVAIAPPTRLLIEAIDDVPGIVGSGYTVREMLAIVHSALLTMGLTDDFCDIVLMVGHGSSSLNNPHEAAHDCGATGGGRGGPNARAFSIMANHPEVRSGLQRKGITIPDTTWFVAGYHNTCDDGMTYYDEDLVPSSHNKTLEIVKQAMGEACVLDAHERCRRFEIVPSNLSTKKAMAFAEQHANDLAEPRPEYGHATNAVCIVGRRSSTRGLFLDRRAFLVSYDPTQDASGELLASLLLSVGPVGAGINLEYYFSFVDPVGYGSGTKLPHNITGLIGVMDGHATDLRTGLPWQMVEIHEPVRLLTIVEASREVLEAILDREPALASLIQNSWIQLVAWDPDTSAMSVFDKTGFRPHQGESDTIPIVNHSVDHYRGRREHLGPAHVLAAFGEAGQ